jgi:hypothetical protein
MVSIITFLSSSREFLTTARTFLTVLFTNILIASIKANNDIIDRILIPYFPYPLAIYTNPNHIAYVDSDNGLRIDNKIRLKYIINHANNLETLLSYISKLDNKLIIVSRNDSNNLIINMMDVNSKVEILSGKEYGFNTIKIYNKPSNLLIPVPVIASQSE